MRPPLDPKSPTVAVLVKLPASLLRVLDAEARRRGLTRAATVRALVAEADKRAHRRNGK